MRKKVGDPIETAIEQIKRDVKADSTGEPGSLVERLPLALGICVLRALRLPEEELHPTNGAPASAYSNGTAPLVSKQEMARLLDCSSNKIDRLVRDGKIPYVVVGGVRRFQVDAVMTALSVHSAVPPTPPDLGRQDLPGIPGVRWATRRTRSAP
jgi:excisionase family DNA binding protein